jgi:hypothetical protein
MLFSNPVFPILVEGFGRVPELALVFQKPFQVIDYLLLVGF